MDVWQELSRYLEQLNLDFDLYISMPQNTPDKSIIHIFETFPDVQLYSVENRGRDVLPFLQILNIIGTSSYTYICKLHTKKSVEIDNGDAWRKLLYYDLIGSEDIIESIYAKFKQNEALALLTGKNLIFDGIQFDLGNNKNVKVLCEQAKIPFHPNYHFAAGTMFWARSSIFTSLLPLLEDDTLDFEDENGQTDNTLAHAMERFFGLLCESGAYELGESDADYSDLDKDTLNNLAMLAFMQRFKNDREIQYRDKLIHERDKKLNKIYATKTYKVIFLLNRLPLILRTMLHFNIKKIHAADSQEYRLVQAIKRRLPSKIITLLKKVRNKLTKKKKRDTLWGKPLTSTSKNKGSTILIIAELSIPQCTKYRVEQKVEMFEHIGYNVWTVSWTDVHEARNLLQLSALVFFYRVPAYNDVVLLITESKRLGLVSFFDVDDLIFDKELLAQNVNLQSLPKKTQKALLKGADLYKNALALTTHSTTSTAVLSKEMQNYNTGKNYIIPNCLDKELLTYISEDSHITYPQTNNIKIVYGSGTSTHDVDFLEVSDALLSILSCYPNVELIIHGTLTLPEKFNLFASQITRIDFVPTEKYYAHLQSYDINLAPLESSLFNDAKSNIKYLEASIFKLPTIASKVAEYRAVIKEGENGFLASNKQSWIDALKKLIESQTLRETIGLNAYKTVMENYQIEHISKKYMLPLLQENMYQKITTTKHILMVNVLYKPISFGGATIVIEELSRRIAKKDHYGVTVFTGFFDENYDLPRPYDLVRYEVNDVPVILVRFPSPMTKVLEYHNEEMQHVFDKILTSLKPDLVHFHSIQQLSASIAKACVNQNIPYLLTLHDMWWLCEKQFMVKPDNTYCYQKKIDIDYCITQCTSNADFTRARTNYLNPILDDAALLLTPSAFQAQMYKYNGFDTNKIKVNKNAIIFPASNYKKHPSDKIRFAYLGGNAVHKGYNFLKNIFESLALDNYELVLVDLHKKLGHNSIITTDWKIQGTLTISDGYQYSQKGLDDFFSNIDVLLFPSQWKESFGLTVREALVRDVWVVSTDAGGVIEDIKEDENGNIVPIGDNTQFKTHVEHLIRNSSKLHNYSNQHKDAIRNYDAQVDELLNYYDKVLQTI